MPVVAIPVEMLASRLGEPRLETEALVGYLKRLGCDVEGWERAERLRCARCGALLEAGRDGAPPPACEGCGRPLKDVAGSTEPAGAVDVVKIDLLPVRPDMLDPGGLARALRHFLGRTDGPSAYAVAPPRISVEVDPGMAERGGAFRPFIGCAVVRGVRLDAELIPVVMKLQEGLHWAMGRDRKLASIGVYDLATLSGERFRYRPVAPEEMRFVPLMCDPADPASMMTPAEVLGRHPKGVAYAHLLEGLSRYPLLEDGRGRVLSMPPIINSEATRVHEGTESFFVDVTGLSERLVSKTLAVTVTSLAEIVPGTTLEAVRIVYPDREVTTPRLDPDPMTLRVPAAAKLIGIDLDRARARRLLGAMGHAASPATEDGEALAVSVPAYRNDVMHEVDLVEDIAMAHGYDAIAPDMVRTMTVGRPLPVEVLGGTARRALTGLGLLEMVTLPLTSPEAAFDAIGLERRQDCVVLANPASVEQTMVRVSLLPGLLEALRGNIRRELPHRIFEVGDVSRLDPEAPTGAREVRLAAVALVGAKVGLADAWSVADALLRELGRELVIRPEDAVSAGLWIGGRATRIAAREGDRVAPVGVMGEVGPAVLDRFGIRAPAAMLEVELDLLGDASRRVDIA